MTTTKKFSSNSGSKDEIKMLIPNEYVTTAEDFADQVVRKTKHVLPTMARLCLISTFLEDGIRMWFDWGTQRDFIDLQWNCGKFIGTLFVIFNLVFQLAGCAMVIFRVKVDIGCGMLYSSIIVQAIGYKVRWTFMFIRYLALLGALLLVLAEARVEGPSLFAEVPTLGDNRPKTYLQLTGRILLAFMFVTLLRFELSFLELFQDIVGGILMVLVMVGYRTKLSALLLVVLLGVINFLHNSFWNLPADEENKDYFKYIFFQTISVIGGLLMIVSLGPGGVSIDERKKKW